MKLASLRQFSLALAGAALLALAACNSGGGSDGANIKGSLSDQGYSIGPAKAPVTVIEYGSLTCPHCAHWEEETWPAFKAKYVDTGKVHFIFREFLIHPEIDTAGALLTHCVSPDKYLATVQAIFRSQPQMFGTPGQPGDVRGALQNVAAAQGMSPEKFQSCLSNTEAVEAIGARNQKAVEEFKIESTPTFIINGQKFDPQADATLDALSAKIDPLLKK